MNELTNPQKENNEAEVMVIDHVLNAHQFLLDLLAKFETAKRGGIHDFIEISLFNMVNLAIGQIDSYLKQGHSEVNANEIMEIITDSYQQVLDDIKRNLEKMGQVNLR